MESSYLQAGNKHTVVLNAESKYIIIIAVENFVKQILLMPNVTEFVVC